MLVGVLEEGFRVCCLLPQSGLFIQRDEFKNILRTRSDFFFQDFFYLRACACARARACTDSCWHDSDFLSFSCQ